MNPKHVRSLCRLAGALMFCAGLGVCCLLAWNAAARHLMRQGDYGAQVREVAFSGDGRFVLGVGTRFAKPDRFGGVSFESAIWRRDLKTGVERAFLLPDTNRGHHLPFAVSPDGARVIANNAVWTLPESGTVAHRTVRLTADRITDSINVRLTVDRIDDGFDSGDPIRAAWFPSHGWAGGSLLVLRQSGSLRRHWYDTALTGTDSLTDHPIDVAAHGRDWLAFVENDPDSVSLTLVIRRDEAGLAANATRSAHKFPLARIDGAYELHWRENRLWILPNWEKETGFLWQPGETRLRELPRKVVEARGYYGRVSGPDGWVAEINGRRDGPLIFLTHAGPPLWTIPIFVNVEGNRS